MAFLQTASFRSHRLSFACNHKSTNKALELVLNGMGTPFDKPAHHFATMSDARLDVQHIQYILRQTLGKITAALINPIFPCLLQIITKLSEEFVKKFRDSLFISLNLVMHSTPKYVIYLFGH